MCPDTHQQVDLESVVRTLYDETNFQREFDARLCGVLATILPDVKCRALIARFGDQSDFLHYVTDVGVSFDLLQDLYRILDRKILDAKQRSRNYTIKDPSYIVVVDLALDIRDEHGRHIVDGSVNNYCVFIGRNALATDVRSLLMNCELEAADHKSYLDYILISYGINYAFRFRKKLFSNFPTLLTREYWVSAVRRTLRRTHSSGGTEEFAEPALRPPWTDGGKRRTATLSLDMRRSTFAMDQSTDTKAYADWIEGFVLVLQQIAHDNFGVFDKFTGDGVLIHFLADECRHFYQLSIEEERRLEKAAGWRTEASSTGQLATRCAVKCGFEMIWAIEHHMTRLRQVLGLDNSQIGPAVGIAIDQAQWSVDRDGGLIVVGRGVVQACRVTGETQKGRIRVTGHAAQMLREIHGHVVFGTTPFASKEFPEGSGVTAEEIERAPSGLCRALNEIHALVESVWHDLDRRSAPLRQRRYG